VNDAKPVKTAGLRPPARNAHRGKLLLQAFRFSKATARFLSQESRIHSAGKPQKRIVSFVEGGLRDLSITRTSIRWGIPVPAKSRTSFTSGSTR